MRYYRMGYSRPLITLDFDGVDIPSCARVTYWICNSCGLIFHNPHMDDEMMNRFYTSVLYRKIHGNGRKGEKERALRLVDWLDETGYKFSSHLDIGCSYGEFLTATHERFGCDIMGVEINAEYPEVPFVNSLDGMTERFDLVSSIHQIEHTFSPAYELLQMSLVAAKYILVEVPAPGTPTALAHCIEFPQWTLRRLLKPYGDIVRWDEQQHYTTVLVEV